MLQFYVENHELKKKNAYLRKENNETEGLANCLMLTIFRLRLKRERLLLDTPVNVITHLLCTNLITSI